VGNTVTDNGLWHGEHLYHVRQAVEAFTRARYTLEPNDEDENGWAPLNPVNQTSSLSVSMAQMRWSIAGAGLLNGWTQVLV
jgi:hypothetical protein